MKSPRSLVLISALLAFASCAPKDEKLVRPGAPNVQAQSVDDLLKLTFITFDNQAEALHLLKALVDHEYAEAKGLTVSVLSETPSKITKRIVGSFTSQSERSAVVLNSNMIANITVENGRITEVKLAEDSFGPAKSEVFAIDKGVKQANPNLTIGHGRKLISIKETNEIHMYDIQVSSVDEVVTTNAKSGEVFVDVSRSQSSSKFVWSGADKLSGPLKLFLETLSHVKHNQSKSEIDLKSKNDVLEIELKNECVSYSGDLKLATAKPAKGASAEVFNFQVRDSTIEVLDKKAKWSALPCAARPVVDINKLR